MNGDSRLAGFLVAQLHQAAVYGWFVTVVLGNQDGIMPLVRRVSYYIGGWEWETNLLNFFTIIPVHEEACNTGV